MWSLLSQLYEENNNFVPLNRMRIYVHPGEAVPLGNEYIYS